MLGLRRRKKFERHLKSEFDALYRTALALTHERAVAEDLLQEASLRAFKSFMSGSDPENFRPWIFRILINLHIDYRRLSRASITADNLEELPTSDKGPAQELANKRLRGDLAVALSLLPDELHLVVQLVLVEGMSYQEAAACIGCPTGTVRSRLSRARQRLKDLLIHHQPASRSGTVLPFHQSHEVRR